MPVLTFNLVNGPGHSSPDDPSLLLANDCAISKLIALTNRRRSSQQKKKHGPGKLMPALSQDTAKPPLQAEKLIS
jgi:hypothetical protein